MLVIPAFENVLLIFTVQNIGLDLAQKLPPQAGLGVGQLKRFGNMLSIYNTSS